MKSATRKEPINPSNIPAQTGYGATQAPNKPVNPITLTKDEQIERAVWIKELGECIRTYTVKPDNPLYKWYFATMAIVLK